MPGAALRVLGLAPLALLGASVAAQDQAAVGAYVEAFNATCQKGFPDLDAVASAALADGWAESRMRSTPGTAAPRAFRKGNLMLLLASPPEGEFSGLCQVTSSADGRATGDQVVAALSPSLAGAQRVAADTPDLEGATWLLADGRDVQAGVLLSRVTRPVSIVARERR